MVLKYKPFTSFRRFNDYKVWPAWNESISQTRRYCLLCGPTSSSGGWLRLAAKAFSPCGQNKVVFPPSGHFWCSVVTLVIFCSNLNNKNSKITKKNPEEKKETKFKMISKVQKIFVYRLFGFLFLAGKKYLFLSFAI